MTTHDVSGQKAGRLHVVHSLEPGGTERLVVDLCRAAQARGVRVGVACLDHLGSWGKQLAHEGVPVWQIGRKPGFRPGVGWTLARIARELDVSWLHCHQYSSFVYGALAKVRQPHLKLVYTEHGRTGDALPLARRRVADRLLAYLPEHVVAVSAELRDYMQRTTPFRDIEVVHNGIDCGAAPTPERRRAGRQLLGASDDEWIVGTVARLDPVKSLGLLVRAFSSLSRSIPSARLAIVGDGPERLALEDTVTRLGVEGRVRFVGHRDDARRLLPAFDVYVNSSTTEGISLTILEALAVELPVVATSVGGTPEVIHSGRTGILVPSGDQERMARVLHGLHSDAELCRALGRAGRARVLEGFERSRMISVYESLYEAT